MARHILLSLFLLISCLVFSQGYKQSYTDPCTGIVKSVSVPADGIMVTYYGQMKTFFTSDFSNGTFDSWAKSVYSSYGNMNPCGSALSVYTQVNLAQGNIVNILSIMNALSLAGEIQLEAAERAAEEAEWANDPYGVRDMTPLMMLTLIYQSDLGMSDPFYAAEANAQIEAVAAAEAKSSTESSLAKSSSNREGEKNGGSKGVGKEAEIEPSSGGVAKGSGDKGGGNKSKNKSDGKKGSANNVYSDFMKIEDLDKSPGGAVDIIGGKVFPKSPQTTTSGANNGTPNGSGQNGNAQSSSSSVGGGSVTERQADNKTSGEPSGGTSTKNDAGGSGKQSSVSGTKNDVSGAGQQGSTNTTSTSDKKSADASEQNSDVSTNKGETNADGSASDVSKSASTKQEVSGDGTSSGKLQTSTSTNGGTGDGQGLPSSTSESDKVVEQQKKTNLVGGAINSIQKSTEAQKPQIILSSDFAGFNFKNGDVEFGGKGSAGYTNVRWDGTKSHGLIMDYTSQINGPNLTAFRANITKRRVDLYSLTGTVGFQGRGSAYASVAVGQLWSFPKVKGLKVIYMAASSVGQVYKEKFIGTALIAGGMYDWRVSKRFDVKLVNLFIYAPYISYHDDLILKSPYVIVPLVGTNVAITKKFKFNVNFGGAYSIGQNVMNFTLMFGTRFAL